jgi:LPXTG-site transpeptidase (sortase) family protein
MTVNKYGNVLTIILIVLVVVILLGLGFLAYKYIIKPNSDNDKKIEAFAEIDKVTSEEEEEEENNEEESLNETVDMEAPTETNNNSSSNQTKTKPRYKGFVMLGYITIPKTNVKEPILDTVTPESLNTAVAVLYPSNPQLNQPGNTVIIGHNYRNGKFFSNNKKLSVGDKVKIKDTSGTELTYNIYEIFETTEQDTSFYNRDTNGKAEITLSTCTDDSKARTIILARAE